MILLKTRLLRTGLDLLYYSRLCALLDTYTGGVGVILMLHHVRDQYAPAEFAPNRGLEVSAAFLDSAISEVVARGYEVIDLEEARRRLVDGDLERRFACFTLDDGYADNYLHALPVFEHHRIPFTLYLNSGMPDGTVLLWWRLLESVVAHNDSICVTVNGRNKRFATLSPAAKFRAYQEIYSYWRGLPPAEQRSQCLALGDRYGIDARSLCREVALDWDQLRDMSGTGLATIGAHTVSHPALTALTREEIVRELDTDCDRIAQELGYRPQHFAYPYGDRLSAAEREFAILAELGFSTATTTRKGVLFPAHAQHLHALPRVSLNGDFQSVRYLRALLSGAPFVLKRGLQRLDVA
jgi:peptidoglycan/xylan/chitin deacetylase (PgdA/CDA1 family)